MVQFDETSIGTNGLANSERALDRLGTALEGEMDSIIYLHNIRTNGSVDAKCGSEQMSDAPPVAVAPAIDPMPVQPAVDPVIPAVTPIDINQLPPPGTAFPVTEPAPVVEPVINQ